MVCLLSIYAIRREADGPKCSKADPKTTVRVPQVYTQEADSPKCSTPMPKVVVGGPQVTGLEGVFLGFYT